MTSLPAFEDVWAGLSESDKKSANILLGNGFSLGAHRGFTYTSLYAEALNQGNLSELVRRMFERYGTNNFERVLTQLNEGRWLAEQLGQETGVIQRDLDRTRSALIDAIAAVHPHDRWNIEDHQVEAIGSLLRRFQLIATVNYDLILYWATMAYMDEQGDKFIFEDGFRPIWGRQEMLGFRGVPSKKDGSVRKGTICYLHGALHLVRHRHTVGKRRWGTEQGTLIDQAREAIEAGELPLFVAEGTWQNKRAQIEENAYLGWSLGQLSQIQGVLFTYGWSLSEQDRHILMELHKNPWLHTVYVGVYEESDSADGFALRSRAKEMAEMQQELRIKANNQPAEPIKVEFYDAQSVRFWDEGTGMPFE